jgi:site-specific recombinase XerD
MQSLPLDAALNGFFFSRDLAPSTAEWYHQKLGDFIAWLTEHGVTDTSQLTVLDAQRFLRELKDRPGHDASRPISSQTVHGYARTIRAFLRHGVKARWFDANDVALLAMPRREHVLIKTYTPADIQALLRAADRQLREWLRERDKALILTLLETGIRAGELCTLTLDNTVLRTADSYLIVTGKGSKQRAVGPLGKVCRNQLHTYIHRWRKANPGVREVFTGDEGERLHLPGLDTILKKLRDRAGITDKRVSAHSFRHTYARSYMARPGADVFKLSVLMGHTDIATTQNYLRDFAADDARSGGSVLDAFLGKSAS